MKEIIIEDHSLEWAIAFQKLKSIYQEYLEDLIMDIQHVGSTSVPGLTAKPVIDIDLIIEDHSALKPITDILAKLGYEYMGDLGIKDREAFKRTSSRTPDDGSMRDWPTHNLYVCINGSIALRNHLALRDFLRANPQKAKEYGELKKRLIAENPFDIDLYILKTLDFDESSLNEIRKANGID